MRLRDFIASVEIGTMSKHICDSFIILQQLVLGDFRQK